MNTIILFLYLADVAVAMQAFLGVIGGVVGVGSLITATVYRLDGHYDDDDAQVVAAAIRCAKIAAVAGVLACLIPAKSTIYTAIGLKVGEYTMETPIGQKALSALEHQLDELLVEE